jgi:hypothetical protein
MVRKSRLVLVALAALLAAAIVALPAVADPVTGAIFTTDSACSGVDLNIYSSKDAVYLNGGPRHDGAAGLPDGEYYVKVTEPNGALLGTSVGSLDDETPVVVSGGNFVSCYQLSAILIKASDGSPGYDTTTNAGAEYKAWVSKDPNFDPSNSKTDNFKVKEGDGPPEMATLRVRKYYDANANGQHDPSETYLTGWGFRIHDHIDWVRFTPANMVVDPDTYYVSEYMPIETNWIETDPSTGPLDTASSMEVPPVPATGTRVQQITLNNGNDETLEFGNVCLGAGGGLTLGFWSNPNGKKLYTPESDNARMVSLNLVQNTKKGAGTAFDPGGYSAYQSWLLKADATNMAYMLSAQLSAMELNVLNGKVNGNALIYAPTVPGANSAGFATVNSLMAEANTELGLHPTAVTAGATRTYQESLMKALDRANNNLNFAQPTACAYTFPNN